MKLLAPSLFIIGTLFFLAGNIVLFVQASR